MSDFKIGDRVYVIDPGLEMLREIMEKATGSAAPNHYGNVSAENDETYMDEARDEMLLIDFDDGICAPYPISDIRHLTEE
jgi:hypothetical protein